MTELSKLHFSYVYFGAFFYIALILCLLLWIPSLRSRMTAKDGILSSLVSRLSSKLLSLGANFMR